MLKIYILAVFLFTLSHSQNPTVNCDQSMIENLKKLEKIGNEKEIEGLAQIYLKFNHLSDEHTKHRLRLLSQIETLKSEIQILNESISIFQKI